jgi:hypothetical protein
MASPGATGSRKFELSFEQFLDALLHVATLRYPHLSPSDAVIAAVNNHVYRLFVARWGEEAAADATAVSPAGMGASLPRARSARLTVVMTPEGVAPATAAVAGPRVTVAVETASYTPGSEPGSGAASVVGGGGSIAGGSGVHAASNGQLKRRQSMKLGLGAASTGPAALASPSGLSSSARMRISPSASMPYTPSHPPAGGAYANGGSGGGDAAVGVTASRESSPRSASPVQAGHAAASSPLPSHPAPSGVGASSPPPVWASGEEKRPGGGGGRGAGRGLRGGVPPAMLSSHGPARSLRQLP